MASLKTRTALAPRDNVTPSALKKKPGTSTEDVKRAAELTAKLKKGEEFLATVVNKEDGGLAADEEEGMDDALALCGSSARRSEAAGATAPEEPRGVAARLENDTRAQQRRPLRRPESATRESQRACV